MALKYYPLTRIITNLYTRGGEYYYPDGRSYTGRYYKTYDGKVYSGVNPVVGTNVELTNLSAPTGQANTSRASYRATQSRNNKISISNQVSDVALAELTPYYPFPLESDYNKGYFTRYFAKTTSGPGYVVEISPTDWSNIENGYVSPMALTYETTSMLWQLTGPLNDKRVSQYQVIGGVYDTNKRVTESKAKGFVGLLAFIGGEYTKYAKITP